MTAACSAQAFSLDQSSDFPGRSVIADVSEVEYHPMIEVWRLLKSSDPTHFSQSAEWDSYPFI